MRYFSMLMLLFITVALSAQEAKQVSVSYVQDKAGPYETIILEGEIMHQIDHDEFILTDKTGSVKIGLKGLSAYEALSMGIVGKTVRVYGVVDRYHQWDNAEIRALKIRVVGSSATAPAGTEKTTTEDPNDIYMGWYLPSW